MAERSLVDTLEPLKHYILCLIRVILVMYHIQWTMRVIKKEWTFVLNSSEFVQLSVFKFVEKTSVFFDPNEFSGP